jgi:hypothetical protein
MFVGDFSIIVIHHIARKKPSRTMIKCLISRMSFNDVVIVTFHFKSVVTFPH